MNEGATPAIYVIVLGQVVVAQDIAQAIAEFDPDATVITTPRREDAVAAVAALKGRLMLGFMNTPPRLLPEDALAQTTRERGGRVVLIHDEADTAGEADDYWVLQRPFTSEAVQDLLERWRERFPRHPVCQG